MRCDSEGVNKHLGGGGDKGALGGGGETSRTAMVGAIMHLTLSRFVKSMLNAIDSPSSPGCGVKVKLYVAGTVIL